MATKFFSKVIMASENIQSYVRSTKYQVSGEDAEIYDGAFVKLGDIVTDTTYASGGKNLNAYYSSAPTDADADKVVVIDLTDVSQGSIGGNVYKIGTKLYGLTIPAGTLGRIRFLALNDIFILGDGNFASAPTAGQYAILTEGVTTLTPSATIPEAGFAVKIIEKQSFEPGQLAVGYQYVCEVVQL